MSIGASEPNFQPFFALLSDDRNNTAVMKNYGNKIKCANSTLRKFQIYSWIANIVLYNFMVVTHLLIKLSFHRIVSIQMI